MMQMQEKKIVAGKLIFAYFALVSQWTACAAEIPADCIYLVASDPSSSKWHASLTTDATHSNWAGGVKKRRRELLCARRHDGNS
jgi:hypothetical protein